MMNDTAVFDAMSVDVFTGETDWTRQTGIPEAIHGYVIDPLSLRYCPHEWINSRGYVDPDLVRKHPHPTMPDRGLVQKIDVVRGGIPPRAAIDAMLAAPGRTNVPLHWIGELSRARDALDEAEQLPDGSERRLSLIDFASDIEERAVQELQT